MWYNLMTDEERANTEFVINLSYGKDSVAMVYVAIEILKIPIHLLRIIHAEVWATDTIPADLPPMVNFKHRVDGYIKGRWGLTVEHVCATRGGGNAPSVTPSTSCTSGEGTSVSCEGSQCSVGRGAKTGSNGQPLEKLTFEKLFYHIPERKDPDNPKRGGAPDGLINRGRGATPNSKCGPILGFPTKWGPWCNSDLKRAALRISHQQSQRRELVHPAQDKGFPKAPGGEGRREISSIFWVLQLTSRSVSPGT